MDEVDECACLQYQVRTCSRLALAMGKGDHHKLISRYSRSSSPVKVCLAGHATGRQWPNSEDLVYTGRRPVKGAYSLNDIGSFGIRVTKPDSQKIYSREGTGIDGTSVVGRAFVRTHLISMMQRPGRTVFDDLIKLSTRRSGQESCTSMVHPSSRRSACCYPCRRNCTAVLKALKAVTSPSALHTSARWPLCQRLDLHRSTLHPYPCVPMASIPFQDCENNRRKVLVVGGGPAGSATAYWLAKAGCPLMAHQASGSGSPCASVVVLARPGTRRRAWF